MSKRPLIYELIDTESGLVLYSGRDKQTAFDAVRNMLIDAPELKADTTFIIMQNGKEAKILARFTGQALEELLEDED